MFALGAEQSRGVWNVDIHWSARPGNGMVGQFLPRQTQACGLDGFLPWRPALALQANPGQGFGQKLARMNLTRMVPAKARDLVDRLFDVWEGPIGFFQPEPDLSYRAPTIAPPTLQLSSEYVVLLRVDRDRGDSLVEALVEMLGGVAQRTDAGTFALDLKCRSTHIGHRRGIVAVCSTDNPETSARHLEHIFAAAEGSRQATWHMDRELKGIVQLWMSSATSRRLGKIARRHGQSSPGGDWIHRFLAVPTGSGLGVSLLPSKDSLRLRLRF